MPRSVIVGAAAIMSALAGAPALHSAQPARIAYIGKNALYTAFSDGTNRVLVVRGVTDNGEFSWSPDGTQIAFSGGHQRAQEVFVVNEDGSGLRQLTKTTRHRPSDGAENPSWSPDGSEIVFDAASDETGGVQQIFLIAADGSNERQLTRGPGSSGCPSGRPTAEMSCTSSGWEPLRRGTRPKADGSI